MDPDHVEQLVHRARVLNATNEDLRREIEERHRVEESLRKSEDGHLWIRLAAKTDLWFVPDVLALYRQHDDNITAPADPLDDCTMRAFELLLADEDFRPYRRAIRQRLARLWLRRGRHYREQRQFTKATGAYVRSLGCSPSVTETWRGLASSVLRRS